MAVEAVTSEPTLTPIRPTNGTRPVVVGGVDRPVLIVSYADAIATLGEEHAPLLRYGFERGTFANGVWAVPHPDEHPEAYNFQRSG